MPLAACPRSSGRRLRACGIVPPVPGGMATVDDVADTLVTQLRGPAPEDDFLNESHCEAAVDAARTLKDVTGEAARAAPDPGTTPGQTFRNWGISDSGRTGPGRHGGGLQGAAHQARSRGGHEILSRGRAGDQRAIARFEREMKAVGRFDHPHIVRAYDAREMAAHRC